uniref:Uncharacterized protein n=2 Tax=Avena sativa TaxID=4498 RepID=A0ACD6AQE4_AVESA
MAHEDTVPEKILHAAEAEVSTLSVKRRFRLFRQTLPPVLAEAAGSESDARLLVKLIFQTLLLYDDRASRKAVDDMVIEALPISNFMKPFASALVRYMKKDLKDKPLCCFKLLRWSSYLLKFTQFATLYENAFSTLANAQVALSQVLIDGSFRKPQNFKKLFFRLFSECSELYKMYIEVIRKSNISSPAFIRVLLDFTVTSPFLFDHKQVFLDLYVAIILKPNDTPSKAASEAFKPLFLVLEYEDFKSVLLPLCKNMLKRNPEIVLQSIGRLLMMVPVDLRKYFMELMPVILPQAYHFDEPRRLYALNIIAALSHQCSDPDTLDSMFNGIKAILGGPSLPYQKVGMLNALERLSKCSPEQISRLAPSVSSFLLMYYNGNGIEEVKLAALVALGTWASVSSEAVQPDVVLFITAGLKEKYILRKGHLKLIRAICKNSGSLTKVTSLLDHLVQLFKTSFSKGKQRLDVTYALYAISRLAADDAKTKNNPFVENLWSSIAPNEPFVFSFQLFSKLVDHEDCITCMDLIQLLLVDHRQWVKKYFSVESLLQVLIYLVCHPNWEVRKKAYDATAKVLSSSSNLAKDLLFLFTDWLSLLGARMLISEKSDMDSSADSQLPFIPSTGVLVKCLLLVARNVVYHEEGPYSRIISCFHHPCILRSASPVGVWKMLGSKQQNRVVTGLISPKISAICKELISQDGLFSSSEQDQCAALRSLSTLMTILPNDTFTAFEKHFIELPDRALHDGFTKNDIKIFFTEEGQLSNEQGIYVDTAKKSLLKDEASVREGVRHVQKNLALMLRALGELATANRIFARDQLPRLVNCIGPLISSPIVSDTAFHAMLSLARCTPAPLCHWAADIAAALRVIMKEDSKNSPSSGCFERIITRLIVACRKDPLPPATFTFIFPILERILLSSEKTRIHDDLLWILSEHLDPIPPIPRPRILSVLYHALSIGHDLPLIRNMLNKLCLGLKCDDLAQALVGVYAKEVSVRLACLTAIQFVPCHSVQQDLQVSTILLIAVNDPEQDVAKLAKELWVNFSCDVCMDYSGIFNALSHKNYNVRVAAANALGSALFENPDKVQDILSTLISSYIQDIGPEAEFGDTNWYGRQGTALALHSAVKVLNFKDVPIILTFLISRGLDDPNPDVRSRMIDAVILIIDKHGKENISLLCPIFESYFNKMEVDEEISSLFRKCYRVFTAAVAKHLSQGDPTVDNAFEKLLDVLNTPLEAAEPPRNMRMEFSFIPFLEHLKSVEATLFDVVYFEGDLSIALKAHWFVSLGESGIDLYHMLFELIESFHARQRCIQRFSARHIRYIPILNRLVFSEEVRDFPFSLEMYKNNVQDVGAILNSFRYDSRKVAARKRNILELDRYKGKLPPYLSVLLTEIASMGSAVNGWTAKGRSIYDLDLAGKSSPAKIALLLGVDLHYDYLPKSQQDKLRNCLGRVFASWKDLAKTVPTLNAVLDFEIWDSQKKQWVKAYYDEFSVQSLWKCGRNHQTHSNGNQLSEKEIEAIFSFMFYVQLSTITKAIVETYEEPTPDAQKKQNKLNIMQILRMK